ncbi:VWA domain-containing protein [Gimesia algae]|uniref:von Willebrand factor type A domain protein n=1 Tax=Gimesia algae TaxID=2527971 RepID=A0A517VKW6_9PLAN|nr:VWA domain-containing protein [Gimesia algae]QDT93668.1 von Willebrand factor type A domain protein [Gimesia algae]
MHFYLKIKNRVEGPYSTEELLYLQSQGQLDAGHLVREGEQGSWLQIEQLPVIRKQRESTVRAAGTQSQREITGIARRPVPQGESERIEKSSPQRTTDGPSQELPRRVPDSSVNRAAIQQRRQKLILAVLVGAFILILLLCLIYWMFLSGPSGSPSGSSSGSQGAGSATSGNKQTEGAQSESSNSTEGTSPATPQPSVDPSPVETTSSSSLPPPPVTTKGAMTPADIPPSFSVGTARFFGIEAKGPVFVYVVDCSGSMSGSPMKLTKEELKKSISQLNLKQSFYVIFFSDQDYPMFFPAKAAPRPLPATDENVEQLEKWVDGFHMSGGTKPQAALLRALSLSPDAIFLMTDGVFDSKIADLIKTNNTGNIAIHTIAFQNKSGEPLLKRIAEENRGAYRYVP